MVKLDNLVKTYGDFRLNLSLEIPDGTVTGIVGKNGAGKSTTIKAILGLIRPDDGSVTINGKDAQKLTGAEKSRIVLLIFFGIIAILIFGSKRIFDGSNALAELTKALDGMTPAVVLLALAAGCTAITCVSYLWSVHIMEKKEF